MISDYFQLALRNLSRQKLRSGLTMIGIVIAIATLFVLVSLSLGLQGAIEEQFRLLGTDKIFIQPRGQLAGPGTSGAVMLTMDDVEIIEKIRGVKDLTYWTAATGEIEFNDETRFFSMVGFPLDRAEVFLESGAYEIDEGRFLEEGDENEIMLGSQYKYRNLFGKPISERDKIIINDEEFRVRAIMQPIGNPGDDRLVLMSIEALRRISNINEERIDTIIVQTEAGENVEEVADRIQKELDKSRDVEEETRDYSILTPEQLIESIGGILNIITGFLLAVAAVSLIVGAIGIANTMYTSVLERTKEIGVMKSVGAKNSDVMTLFVIESGLLGLVGGIIGILLGYGISKGIEYIAVTQLATNLLAAATPFYLFAGALGFSFLVGILSGALPAWRASKTNPVDALRYE